MHRGHRVPRVEQVPGPELGGQLTEPGRQHRRVLGGELPGRLNFSQVTVRVLQRHAGLPRASQATQGHCPRLRTVTAGQPDVQLREQVLPPGQDRRRVCQPHRLARDSRPLLHHLADSDPGTVGKDRARPQHLPSSSLTAP